MTHAHCTSRTISLQHLSDNCRETGGALIPIVIKLFYWSA